MRSRLSPGGGHIQKWHFKAKTDTFFKLDHDLTPSHKLILAMVPLVEVNTLSLLVPIVNMFVFFSQHNASSRIASLFFNQRGRIQL